MKDLLFVAVVAVSITGSYLWIKQDYEQEKNRIYKLLEKETLTVEEMETISELTDPNRSKEAWIELDEKHAKLFKDHFGFER